MTNPRFDGDQDEIYGVTKEMFTDYVELQRSGKTNMWGASRYLGWSPVSVISHYKEMYERWPDVVAQGQAAVRRTA